MKISAAVEDSNVSKGIIGDERRNSDSGLLKNQNDQVINKVQKQLQDIANCKIEEGSPNVKAGNSRTVRAQNGTVVNKCDQGATVDQAAQQKDSVNTHNSTVKGSNAT